LSYSPTHRVCHSTSLPTTTGHWRTRHSVSSPSHAATPNPDTIVRNGRVVNVHTGEIREARGLVIADGRIARVTDSGAVDASPDTEEIDADGQFLAPGFLDTHVHYESSMTTATGFARGVVPTGTTGAFIDPHEIGNVPGLEGIRCLLDEAADLSLKTFCTIPSSVPAAPGFEDAGAVIDSSDVREALQWDDVIAFGETMNYPGVVAGDDGVHEKLAATYGQGLEATGHFASRETGADLDAFIAAGITSCHEGVRKEEAFARLRKGMWTMLRQGSAWKDVPESIKAVTEMDVDTRHLLLVSDDTYPEWARDTAAIDAPTADEFAIPAPDGAASVEARSSAPRKTRSARPARWPRHPSKPGPLWPQTASRRRQSSSATATTAPSAGASSPALALSVAPAPQRSPTTATTCLPWGQATRRWNEPQSASSTWTAGWSPSTAMASSRMSRFPSRG
jgi:adenine deaminase